MGAGLFVGKRLTSGGQSRSGRGVLREESRHREKKGGSLAREKEREEDTVCSVVHIIFSRDVISEIHTRDTQVSYVTKYSRGKIKWKEMWEN